MEAREKKEGGSKVNNPKEVDYGAMLVNTGLEIG
jgi:hypothetical protein